MLNGNLLVFCGCFIINIILMFLFIKLIENSIFLLLYLILSDKFENWGINLLFFLNLVLVNIGYGWFLIKWFLV